MDFELHLEKIGLSRQEAKVYINTLKLGIAKASEIAQKSDIKREASYYILKTLQEKGFISEVIKSGVKYYNAVQPKRILEIIEEEKQQKTEFIKEILPDLESLQNIALTRPKIEVYEGLAGLKTVLSLLVQNKNQTIFGYVPEKIIDLLPIFSLQFRKKRKENKIFIKVITEKSKLTEELKKKDKEELREIKFNDSIIKGMDVAVYIQNESIIIIKANEKEQLGVYIKEENVAKLQKSIFEEVWKIVKLN